MSALRPHRIERPRRDHRHLATREAPRRRRARWTPRLSSPLQRRSPAVGGPTGANGFRRDRAPRSPRPRVWEAPTFRLATRRQVNTCSQMTESTPTRGSNENEESAAGVRRATKAADELWQSITSFMENDARVTNSILETQLSRFLGDIGTKLAGEPEVRADINRGMMMVIRTFVQNQKREIAKFIGNQIKSWDVRQMTSIIELNIGADPQYIRLNCSIIGGLAGLGLYAGEQALRFY
jgi:Protein of unknown function (DUF445)